MHMKRTRLLLDERLLEKALRLGGERSYSGTVNRGLAEFVRRAKAGRILDLAGSGLWEDDLTEMRGEYESASQDPPVGGGQVYPARGR